MTRIENVKEGLGFDHLDPFNQRAIKKIREARRRSEGDRRSKGYRADQRRLRQQQFIENIFPKMQFERALGHMADGKATTEEKAYVFRQADKFGRPMGEATILNFPRNGKS